jgi:crossover junction endodeoxyribonuclease RuvC
MRHSAQSVNILGVDPGVRGGLAIVSVDTSGAALRLVDAIDIPVTGVGAKERVDVLAIRSWIVRHAPQHALIERAQAMPKQGASSGFKYGRAVGAIEAVIACCTIPLTIVEPSIWKKFHALRGGDKEAGRQRALQLFPAAHALLARKKDHGRAEAALIALYGVPSKNPEFLRQQDLCRTAIPVSQ